MEIVKALSSFIDHRKWLSFRADKFYNGICNGGDLPLMFVPDMLAQIFRKKLEFGGIELESLDSLKNDISKLEPVIQLIFDF